MLLEVSGVSKVYPGLPVLKEISFRAAQGEIVCLLGPSGCGKTTLLRIVAGLESPDTGRVCFDGQDLAGLPVHRRNFGFMFQDYALFPHRDVAANIVFGLRMQALPSAEAAARVREMLALVGLSGYERRRVLELSGGEQQRVALARSLAPRPRLLMLDEPLGALDRALREQLMNDLRGILKRVNVTALYVTHDQEEAFAIADRVLILRAQPESGAGGWIEQDGTPQQVYRRPATAYVARFLGFKNLVPGVIAPATSSVSVEAGVVVVDTPLGRLTVTDASGRRAPGQPVTVLIRPEAAQVRAADAATVGAANAIAGRLLEASFRGSYYLIRTEHAGGVTLTCEAPATDADLPAVAGELVLWLDPAAVTLLAP